MNKRVVVIASLVGVVFLFAGYNLYSYFQTQAEIAAQEQQLAQERRLERERQNAQREAERRAEQERLEAEKAARIAQQAQDEAEQKARRDLERVQAEAKFEQERKEREQAEQEQEQAQLEERIKRARSREQIEDFSPEIITRLRSMSPRYLEANPDEALFVHSVPENGRVYPSGYGTPILYRDQSTFLMVAAAVSQNPDIIDTVIGLGADINAANKMGFTALMFAAAYNTPEMVQYLLDQGAEPQTISLAGDANALHIAASLNPNPDVMDVLIGAGLPLEGRMTNGDTPLLLASEENTNLEVVERLVELGADVSAFNADGVTPLSFITQRLENRGKNYVKISDELNTRVLQAVTDLK